VAAELVATKNRKEQQAAQEELIPPDDDESDGEVECLGDCQGEMDEKEMQSCLEKHNVPLLGPGGAGRPRKKGKPKNNTDAKFKACIRQHALELAGKAVKKELENNGHPLDIQLKSGQVLWQSEMDYSPEETGGKGNCFCGPLIRVGADNEVAPLAARTWEAHKIAMSTELANKVLDYANQLLGEVSRRVSDDAGTVVEEASDDAGTVVEEAEEEAYDAGMVVEEAEEEAYGGDDEEKADQPLNVAAGGKRSNFYPTPQTIPLRLLTEEQVATLVDRLLPTDGNDAAVGPAGVRKRDLLVEDCCQLQRFVGNLVLTKVGKQASYHKHQDSSFLLCSPLTEEFDCVANGGHLPPRGDMAVVTFVVGLGDCRA
jgi:hypothetical protein